MSVVTFRYRKLGKRNRWPSDRPKFLEFVLYKENKDTTSAVSLIARMLHLKTRSFSYAGTKDKRAVTSQKLTAFKVEASDLASLNQRLRGIAVGNYKYVPEKLRLGDLSGILNFSKAAGNTS